VQIIDVDETLTNSCGTDTCWRRRWLSTVCHWSWIVGRWQHNAAVDHSAGTSSAS